MDPIESPAVQQAVQQKTGIVRRTYPIAGRDSSPASRAEALKTAVLMFGGDKTGNNLGANISDPKPQATHVSLTALVGRYPLLITTADLVKLKAAAAKLKRESDLISYHSGSAHSQRISEASARYAQDPSPENHKALAEIKTLSDADHALVQQMALNRKREVGAKEILPIEQAVYPRFLESLTTDVESLMLSRLEQYSAFGVEAQPDPLITDLLRIQKLYQLHVEHRVAGKGVCEEMPDLLEAILAVSAEQK